MRFVMPPTEFRARTARRITGVGVDGIRLVQKHRLGSMETTLLELLAAATWARIVPSDLAATQRTNFWQPGEKVDRRGRRSPVVANAHLDFDILNIAEKGEVHAFPGVGCSDQVDGLNRAEIDEPRNQKGVQYRTI